VVHDRDLTIDILRGLAIVTMVGSNMAASITSQPHPFWLRLYGSFAAPLFFLLSGMMVSFTAQIRDHAFRYYLFRGIMIVMTGVFIDVVILNICPFVDYDTLYLIGFSVPLTFLYLHLGPVSRWSLIILIFALTPFLQKILGYTEYVNPIILWGERVEPVAIKTQTTIFIKGGPK